MKSRHVAVSNAVIALVALATGIITSPVAAQDSDRTVAQTQLTPAQLFEFADAARAAGDFSTATTAYRALAEHPEIGLRNEARFRLAMMRADQQQDYQAAAILFRQILDEQPEIARVRIELARMQAMMGNLRAAAKELRAAQAAGLPDEVERLVRFYASALSARKPFGFNIDLALAPDSNINRATQSRTLETIIGNFDLSEDAQAQSGIGAAVRGQAYFRTGIDSRADLLVRASGSGRFYRKNEFDDYIAALQVGPQYTSGADSLSISGTASWRWFGQDPYSFSYGLSANYQHPLDQRTQLRVDGAAIHSDDKLNDLRDSTRYSLAVGVDRAFSARFGGGARISAYRDTARDAGYSTAGGGVDAYLFREIGSTTAVARIGYDRLEADTRLFLYPRRRTEDRLETSISATFRSLRVGPFAPLASARFERNYSTIEIYDYQRVAAEVGITAAF